MFTFFCNVILNRLPRDISGCATGSVVWIGIKSIRFSSNILKTTLDQCWIRLSFMCVPYFLTILYTWEGGVVYTVLLVMTVYEKHTIVEMTRNDDVHTRTISRFSGNSRCAYDLCHLYGLVVNRRECRALNGGRKTISVSRSHVTTVQTRPEFRWGRKVQAYCEYEIAPRDSRAKNMTKRRETRRPGKSLQQ